MIVVVIVLGTCATVACRIFWSTIGRRKRQNMFDDVDAIPSKRRDSELIASLEEAQLRQLHKLMLMPIKAMAALTPGVPPESTINFVSINGGMRESTLNFSRIESAKVAPSVTANASTKVIQSIPIITETAPSRNSMRINEEDVDIEDMEPDPPPDHYAIGKTKGPRPNLQSPKPYPGIKFVVSKADVHI